MSSRTASGRRSASPQARPDTRDFQQNLNISSEGARSASHVETRRAVRVDRARHKTEPNLPIFHSAFDDDSVILDAPQSSRSRIASSSAAAFQMQESRTIGLFGGINMIIGMMVGSGIFSSPGHIQALTDGYFLGALMVWLSTGILALFGALCYAELGTLMPESGGEQPYLQQIYGDLVSFLFSWFSVLVGKPCSVAIILLVFAEYALPTGTSLFYRKLLAVSVLTLLTLLNARSSRLGIMIQNVSTVLKMAGLVFIVISGLIYPLYASHEATDGLPHSSPETIPKSTGLGSYALAFYQGLWAYDGWNNLNFIAGEVINPGRNIPLSIFIGIPAVISIYLLVIVSYWMVVPTALMTSSSIGIVFGQQLLGHGGAAFIGLCVAVSTFGSSNASIYSSGRLTWVAAKESYLPFSSLLTWVHPRYETPIAALFLQYVLTTLFIISGTYSALVNLYSWVVWVFYAAAVTGVIIMRRRAPEKDWTRVYKVPLPAAILFIMGALLLIIIPIITTPFEVLAGVAVLIVGIPMYYLKRYIDRRREYQEPGTAEPRFILTPTTRNTTPYMDMDDDDDMHLLND